MPCGCADNKNISKDKLSVDTMKDLSIDEIISLYRKGYALEEHEIKTMDYASQCSGTPGIAIDNTSGATGSYPNLVTKGSVFAQRFLSTFRCFDTIQILSQRLNDVNFNIEIREDIGGLPSGAPGTSNGRVYVSPSSLSYLDIPTAIGYLIESPPVIIESGRYYWICFIPVDFYDSATYRTGPANYRFNIYDGTYINGHNEAFYYGGVWNGPNLFTSKMAIYNMPTFTLSILTSIAVAPITVSVNVGATTQLSAVCKDQNNATMTCPTLVWSSSNSAIASVNSSGLVTGVAAGGPVNITASASGITSNASAVTVTSPTPVLTSIVVTPATASINIGATTQLSAVCKDQNNATMTCPTLAWVSSNPAIASVNSSGLVTGVAAGGPVNITASASGITSNASAVTISAPSQVLTVITISPASQSINIGGIVQLSVVCKNQNNVTMTCPALTWASSNSAIASVNSSGLVTGVAAGGPVNITASASGITSNISVITVTGTVSVLTSIVVSPTSASIGIGGTRQLTATCKDQNTATMTCPTLVWSSSNSAIASVNSSGLVTGVAVGGPVNVTASASGITSNISVVTVTTTPPPQAGGGGMIIIAAVAVLAAAMFMARKPPSPPV